jgi:flagellar biosynthetic protein FliQ
MTLTEPQAMDLGRSVLMITLQLSAPVLVVGMVVGLAISLFQAVTQLQEQTLTFVPKLVAMAVAMILLMPWYMVRILEFSRILFGNPHVMP